MKLMNKEIGKALGLKLAETKLPPKFKPKLSIRIGDGRSKQVYEIEVDIPVEGYSGQAWEETSTKLHLIFEKLGLLKTRPVDPTPPVDPLILLDR